MKEKQPYTPATAGTVGQQTTEPWGTPEQAEPTEAQTAPDPTSPILNNDSEFK